MLLERPPREGENEPVGPPDPAAIEAVELPVYDRFAATRTATVPAAYLLPAAYPEAATLLARQGILVERLAADWTGAVTRFTVDELKVAERSYQGHRLTTLEGRFEPAEVELPAGTFLIRTAQPLARLLFHLAEPESTDGLSAWGLLDRGLRKGGRYPILKCAEVPAVARHRFLPRTAER